MNPADTPLLLIVWRRPLTLRKVINAIRPVAPRHLYVACDGPNSSRPGEADKVAATRLLIDQEIDWPCKLHRLYSEENQGCSIGPIRAISWFFEQVDEGIILEDDCVPHPDFFTYCATLLEHYRDDARVWCISGNNFQNGQWRGEGSYYFSRYSHGWGWASWRRCWKHYDPELIQWPALRDSGLLETLFEYPIEREYWTAIWQRTYERIDLITWWDYQWMFACLSNSGLTTLPNHNLVSNVGFGPDGTHTTSVAEATLADHGLGAVRHPTFIVRDTVADRYGFDNHFGGAAMLRNRMLLPRLKSWLRRHFHKLARHSGD